MQCPNCRLENPPSAERCDCGYDFAGGLMRESYAKGTLSERSVRSPWILTIDVLLLLVNMFLSGASGLRAGQGGGYVVGAMLSPAIIAFIVLAIAAMLSKRSRSERAMAKIVLVTMIVLLLGNMSSALSHLP